MKQKLLLLFTMAIAISARAQFNYHVTTLNEPYVPLTNGANLNGPVPWTQQNKYNKNVGFSFKLNGSVVNELKLNSAVFVSESFDADLTGFVLTQATYHDRGNAGGGITKSPIRYEVTGTAGSRILKIEYFNMGFEAEFANHSTSNDSANVQVWIYEGSNIVELRYGPSKITNPNEYFFPFGKPFVVYAINFQFNGTFAADNLYYLTGDPKNPTVDSTDNATNINGLNTYPPDGTVYRYTPKGLSVGTVANSLSGIDLINNIGTEKLVVSSTYAKHLKYTIYSLDGRATSSVGTISKGINNISVSSLPAGMYILQVSGSEGVSRFRVNKI